MANKAIDELKVIIQGDISKLKSALREATKQVSDFKAGFREGLEMSLNETPAMSKLQKLRLAVKSFQADAKVKSGMFDYTDEFRILSADIQRATQELHELEMAKKAAAMYHGEDSDEYREIANEADAAKQRLENLYRVMQRVSKNGGFTKFKGGIAVLRRVGSAVSSVGKRLGQLAGGAIRRAGGAFGALIKRMASASMAGRLLSRVFGGGGAGGLVSSLLKVCGVVAIAKIALEGLKKVFNWMKEGIKEGFQNMAAAMPTGELARNMNTLKNSLSQLKGALASAAAPIFNALAPALNSIIQLAIKAANAVGALMAALTGKKYVVAATGAASDYSSGLASTADNASAAKDAVDALKKSIMGFDAINKLDDNDSSSGSGGSGGGGSGGSGGGIGGGFEEVGISNEIMAFADKIKEAWKNADFTEIGTIVGTKLKNALDSIQWDKIKETCNKVAQSVATFLNGFFETPGLFTSIGKTAAEGVNTALGALNTFAYTFHWDSLGKAISDSVNGFFKTFDWKLAADTFSNWAKGVFTAMYTALENIDWREIGRGLKEFLKSVDWNGIADAMFEAIGAAIGGIASFFVGLFEEVPGAIKKYFADHIQEAKDAGGNIVTGILSGIVDALKAIGTWIKEHIFDPFIKGFKKAFGIASPSKEMEPLGQNIVEGILEGLKSFISKIINWFLELPGKIKEALGNAKDWIKKALFGDKSETDLGNHNVLINIVRKAKAFATKLVDWLKSAVFGASTETGLGNHTALINVIRKLKSALSKFATWVKEQIFGKNDTGETDIGDRKIKIGLKLKTGIGKFADWVKKALGIKTDGSSDADATIGRRKGWGSGQKDGKSWKEWISGNENGQFTSGASAGIGRWKTWATGDHWKKWISGSADGKFGSGASAGIGRWKTWSGGDHWKKWISGSTDGKFFSGASAGINRHKNNWASTTWKKWISGRDDGNIYGASAAISRKRDPNLRWDWASWMQTITGNNKGTISGIAGLVTNKWVSGNGWNWNGWMKTITGNNNGQVSGISGVVTNKWVGGNQNWSWGGWMKTITGNWSGHVTGIGAVVTGKWVGGKENWSWGGWMKTITGNVQGIISGITAQVSSKILGRASGGVLTNAGWNPIQRYASGGNPFTGQMFIAREAGPELVGTLSGHTAVMNNDQIVASVSAGVYRAVSAAMQRGGGQQGTPVEMHVYVGGKEVTDYVIKDVNNRTLATGRSPFIN